MTIAELTGLLGVLAWPAVVLLIAALFRPELKTLFNRFREIEGPGGVKLSLDPAKVERIIKEGRMANKPEAAVAESIVRAAVVFDKREARILRALLDDEGRGLYSYQSDFYRSALDSLLAKGYVRRIGKGFALTEAGTRITKEYVLGVLQDFASPQRPSEAATENS